MKPIFWITVCSLFCLSIMSVAVFGQDASNPPSVEEWVAFVSSIKGFVGLGQLGLAAVVVQGVLFMTRAKFIPLPGKYKLIIVQALSVISGVVTLRLANFDWASAIMHANTLGAVQVFVHQIIKQWTEDKNRYEIPPIK